MAVIWLIEDNAAFRNATQLALSTKPELYSPQVFGSCEDALSVMKQGGKPDLILLDIELPGMDGIEGIQHFQKLAPEVSILILTVFENDDKIFRALCAGACGYLLKLDPLPNIILAINQAIEGGAPISPHIARRVLGMFSKLAPVKKDYGLSAREQEVLEWMVEGLSKKQIADKLELSAHTVNSYLKSVYRKLHVNCQAAAVSAAIRGGLSKY